MHKIALLILAAYLPLSAGCGQSSMAKVVPEDAYLQETRQTLEDSPTQKASEELWHLLYRRKSQNILSKKGYEEYISRINFWIERGGRVGIGRIACLKRSKKISDEVVKILEAANQKAQGPG